MSKEGHNSTTVAAGQLKALVERIERLEEEKKEVAEHIKEVFAEAKGNGFDTKTLRRIIALRKKTADERAEEEAMTDLYMSAMGMQLPLDLMAPVLQESDKASKRLKKAHDKLSPVAEFKRAVSKLGTPRELTDDEKASGVVAAFDGRDGEPNVSISIPNSDA